ncbi:MAG: hypothetical protein IPK61_07235 [Saprospiraceae bacterium]|nr:hypothetical protein [Saprospiraceae bacterium]
MKIDPIFLEKSTIILTLTNPMSLRYFILRSIMLASQSACPRCCFMWTLLEKCRRDPEIKRLVDNRELYFVPCLNLMDMRTMTFKAHLVEAIGGKNVRPNTEGDRNGSQSQLWIGLGCGQ